MILLRSLGQRAVTLRRRKATAVLTHYHFSLDGSRYRAKVVPYPEEGKADRRWFVSIDNGPERPAGDWLETDVPGPELEKRLAGALGEKG